MLPEVRVKYQREVDYASASGLIRQVRTYRSDTYQSFQSKLPVFLDYSITAGEKLNECLPFQLELGGRPLSQGNALEPVCFQPVSTGVQDYQWTNGEGRQVAFTNVGGAYLPSDNKRLRAFKLQPSNNWVVVQEDDSYSVFAPNGALLAEHFVNGRSVTYTSEGAGSIRIADNFGRTARLTGVGSGTVSTFVDPAGGVFHYENDRSAACPGIGCTRLASVTYPDGTTRRYLWNEASLAPGSTLESALTGTIDELGTRVGWYGYDSSGNAISTERGNGIDRYRVTGVDGYAATVQDPLGSTYRFGYQTILGSRYSTGVSQPAGSGSAATGTNRTFDAAGNLTQATGLNGMRSCYAYDPARKEEAVRVEGLPGTSCTQVIAINATLPAGSRKISTQWHPDWRLETKVAEPGKLTSLIYNGQPDPFNGNAVASCAPASAQLPDGKPIAVVCKQVEQATTDSNGAAGFSATLQAGVANRVSSWTYNQHGQVLTEDGPRTDINDTTTYAYYSDTSFTGEGIAAEGHFMGDLQSITNAAGRVTQYTKYNKHGQVLESVDPNGVVTTNTYDARMRLLSTTTAGQATSYTYDPAGQLKRVTLPDQSWIGYDYDGAHRQTAVYDHQGNRTEYVLDNAGNRTGEHTTDPSGALKRQLTRSIDALGRVQQTTGRE